MDLTPRPAPDTQPSKRRRKIVPTLVLVLVIGAGAVIVTQFLTSAIDYYCNVDEVGVKDGCDPGRRLRIQGVVDEGSVQNDGVVTSFSVSFNGAQLPVRY
ncbi:MAG: cytochrome c-type biosis protein CcmE, partial [Actinomycetota bacterium]